MKKEDFTFEFIKDLHAIVGIDAVAEFYKTLVEDEPELVQDFIDAVEAYYDKLKEERENEARMDLL